MSDTRLASALEALDTFAASALDDRSQLIATKCRGLIRGYHAKWKDADFRVDGVEVLVTSDLWNPDTQRKSQTFKLAGKLDVTGWRDGRRVIIDHKTSSDDIADPCSPFWRQLVVEAQPSHYALMEWLNGRKVDEIIWDVIRKPGISPRGVPKGDAAETARSGFYFGQRLSLDAIGQLRATGREDLEMYEARLAHDCTSERPEWYFQRRTTPRLDTDLHEYARELWNNGQEVLHARNTERHSRNHKACMYKNSPCKFLGVCSGHDSTDSDNWQVKQQVHNELPLLVGDGRDVLTNSRLGDFMLCRQKHYLSYELGIERMDDEEADALFFGNLWHSAQENWWLAAMKEQEVCV